MQQLDTTGFKQPYPQEALGGELGLTSADLAASQKIKHWSFRKRLIEDGYLDKLKAAGLNFSTFRRKIAGQRGRPQELLVFPVETAKIILAQSRTNLGLTYAVFLVNCEKALHKAAELIGEERQRICELIEENEKLRRQVRRPRLHSIKVEVIERTMFGEETTKQTRRKYLANMTIAERRAWTSLHCTRIAEGASKSSKEIQTFEKDPRPLLPSPATTKHIME